MSASSFTTEVRAVPDVQEVRVMTVEGRITYREAHDLRHAIFKELDLSTYGLVIDLGQVQNMDTSGAAVLVEVVLASKQRDQILLLCSPSHSVMRIFRLAGLEEVLGACCEDDDETMQRLKD